MPRTGVTCISYMCNKGWKVHVPAHASAAAAAAQSSTGAALQVLMKSTIQNGIEKIDQA
jgi:hypothetical protein